MRWLVFFLLITCLDFAITGGSNIQYPTLYLIVRAVMFLYALFVYFKTNKEKSRHKNHLKSIQQEIDNIVTDNGSQDLHICTLSKKVKELEKQNQEIKKQIAEQTGGSVDDSM